MEKTNIDPMIANNPKVFDIDGRKYSLHLCIQYSKPISVDCDYMQIQPGDLEISYKGGESKYVILGQPADCIEDDAGYTVVATQFKSVLKEWLASKKLVVRKFFSRSKLLDYHELFNYDDVGQWKIFLLEPNGDGNDKARS